MELQATTCCMLPIFWILNMLVLVDGGMFCQPGTPLPNISQTGLPCYSCKDKCGSRDYCSCDTKCLAYGDCCPDFKTVCPQEFKNGKFLQEHFQYRHTICLDLLLNPRCFEAHSFVSVCGRTGQTCDSTKFRNLDQPNLALPVTDHDTGVSYVNFECAKCNGVSNMTWMKPSIFCKNYTHRISPEAIEDQGKLHQFLNRSECFVQFTLESTKGIHLSPFCYKEKHSCLASCNNPQLVDKCENGFVTDYVRGAGREVYDNTYCALCNKEELEEIRCDQKSPICVGEGYPSYGYSVTILFDFNPTKGLAIGQHPCPQYQARIGGTGECRQVACPDTLRFVKGACFPLNLTVNFMTVTLIFDKTNDAQQAVSWFTDNKLTDKAEEGIFIQLNQSMYSRYQSEVKFNVIQHVSNLTGNQFNISFTIDIMFDVNSTLNFGDNLHQIINVTAYMNDQILLALAQAGTDLDQVEIIIDDSVTFNHKPLEDCTWFVFTKDEFTFINNSLRLIVTNKLYDETHYRLTGEQVIVCVSTRDRTAVVFNISPTLIILSLVLICLSIVCLLIRIILQFLIPYYNSFSARLHANLCLALMLAFIMVLVAGTIGQHNNLSGGVKGQKNAITASVESQHYLPLACALSGTVMYWFFMAAFIWMTALSIDAWLKFHPKYGVERRFDDDKSIAAYAVPCWLIPLLISGGVLGLDFTGIDSRFRPEFGRRLCWFNQRYALLAYFGSVVAICMLLIIPFLIQTARNIPAQPQIRSTLQRHNVWIYLRLAALMGVSWVCGFVAAFVGHEAVWVVFIVLNASQGIFIFISFVINRKVLQQCCHRKEDSSGSGQKESRLHVSSSTEEHSESPKTQASSFTR